MAEAALAAIPETAVAPPLSELHAMLGQIERDTDPHRMNRVINAPEVYPAVKGYTQGRLDAALIVANPANVLLMAELGGVFFQQMMPGLYEAHTQVLSAGRGQWAVRMTEAALHWMFTRTDALEIFTRVPHGNLGALGLVRAIHGSKCFTRKDGWVVDFDPVPADIYTLTVHDWMKHAPGLVERGRWFHVKLEAEYARLGCKEPPHADDETHDRYVGAACEFFMAGTAVKGMVLYNRWAAMSGYVPVAVISLEPLTVDIRDAIICVRDNNFWVMACR